MRAVNGPFSNPPEYRQFIQEQLPAAGTLNTIWNHRNSKSPFFVNNSCDVQFNNSKYSLSRYLDIQPGEGGELTALRMFQGLYSNIFLRDMPTPKDVDLIGTSILDSLLEVPISSLDIHTSIESFLGEWFTSFSSNKSDTTDTAFSGYRDLVHSCSLGFRESLLDLLTDFGLINPKAFVAVAAAKSNGERYMLTQSFEFAGERFNIDGGNGAIIDIDTEQRSFNHKSGFLKQDPWDGDLNEIPQFTAVTQEDSLSPNNGGEFIHTPTQLIITFAGNTGISGIENTSQGNELTDLGIARTNIFFQSQHDLTKMIFNLGRENR